MDMEIDDVYDPIAALSALNPDPHRHYEILRHQIIHRQKILQQWGGIRRGSKVLELGCGQGDCTIVLAEAVGEEGHVVAVDPGDKDYGAPITLGQAQSVISQGPLGRRITWVQKYPLDYLSSLKNESHIFDVAVFCHSLWYFESKSRIVDTFRALKQHCMRLQIAEWSLVASDHSAQPHVLAAVAQAALECRKPETISNIRIVLSPNRLIVLAYKAGWQLQDGQVLLECDVGLKDGEWEVSRCLSTSFEKEVVEYIREEEERAAVLAARDACEMSAKGVQNTQKKVKAMDVWVASFV